MNSLVWPGTCPVTQPWGCTDLTLEPYWPACPSKHFHCGIDVGMVIGTPLRAARAGVVVYVGYGLLAIRTDDSSDDWYVHIDHVATGISPFSGVRIEQGQLVAYSGDKVPSGGSLTGPHLHFECQRGTLNNPSTSFDPVPILLAGQEDTEMLRLVGPGNAVYLLSGGLLVGLSPADNSAIAAAGVQAATVDQTLIDAIKAASSVSVTIPPLALTGEIKPA